MYIPTYWKDEVVEHPYRYKETQNSDGTIEHTPNPGDVLQEGTPQSADNFNNMEHGIFEALALGTETARVVSSVQRKVVGLTEEAHRVTLTNKQEYPFNDSTLDVRLSPERNTKEYTVTVEPVSTTGGALGDVEITNKLLNGFKVHFTGSAKSATINLFVKGGI